MIASTAGAKSRWVRPIAVSLTVVLCALATYRLVVVGMSPFGQIWAFGTGDLVGYTDGARRFLETGSPYLPDQVGGPWELGPRSFIHPPIALFLFVPFLVIPWVIWWIIPIAVTITCIVRLRPASWTWPVMAACLLWPRSTGSLLAGNTDIWVSAFFAAGAVYGWPLALIAIKPTFAPLAAIGIRDRRTWFGAGIAATISLAMLPLWFQWAAVIQNAGLSAAYSLLNLPLVMIPVIAALGRSRTRPMPPSV